MIRSELMIFLHDQMISGIRGLYVRKGETMTNTLSLVVIINQSNPDGSEAADLV